MLPGPPPRWWAPGRWAPDRTPRLGQARRMFGRRWRVQSITQTMDPAAPALCEITYTADPNDAQ